MGADRVEVAEQADPPARVGSGEITADLLDHELGAPVGVRGPGTGRFGDRQLLRIAVDGGRRREDEVPHVVMLHAIEEVQRGDQVHPVVVERNGDGLTDRLQPGEVDHRLDRVFLRTRRREHPRRSGRSCGTRSPSPVRRADRGDGLGVSCWRGCRRSRSGSHVPAGRPPCGYRCTRRRR